MAPSDMSLVDELRNEIKRLEKALDETLAERDATSDQCQSMARQAGCKKEWSNFHDHTTCVQEAFEALAN